MRDGKWHYKVETYKQSVWSYKPKNVDAQISERLNRLGMEGWELVAIKPYGHYTQMYLKRPF
ncbi:DUF4177 domain-containing protein [Hellea balneolensis]|uniref:DUF4177 domain-containing protein n=1 Tax=Hellea balneolensis TaxID=287478 RepID=UPI000426D54B|nr:DUF4177 domain-containing protein [Hellea balneolensis]